MIKILFFASFREQLGQESLILTWEPQWRNVGDVLVSATVQLPGLAHFLENPSRLMIALNQDMARRDSVVKDGDEIALLPPVTGG